MMIFVRALAPLLLFVCALQAVVDRVEVHWSGVVLDGKEFGATGAYEAMRGTVYFHAESHTSDDWEIVDLDLAPKNQMDDVEFSADFFVLWPLDANKGNGTVICEVVNRGNKLLLPFFQNAERIAEPVRPEHFGDGFLMNQGYTLLWVGWQHDVPDGDDRIRVHVPIARNVDGTAIRGLVRSEILVVDRVYSHTLADRDHKAYPVADPGDDENVLTVRDSREGARRVVPRSQWKFARMENGEVVADPTRVYLEGGFEPHKVYEVVYVAEDPPLAGLGMLALRDMAAYMKQSEDPLFGVQEYRYERAYAFGVSQSGRLLRTMLYHGLNKDDDGERVFDGMLVHVAGGGRGSFNIRFAQPSRDGHPFQNMFYPTDIFPFSDQTQLDPETADRDGLLRRIGLDDVDLDQVRAESAGRSSGLRARLAASLAEDDDQMIPKIFYTNSSYEYWGRAASQTHTTIDAGKDLAPHPFARVYLFSGTQHGPQAWPPVHTQGQQLANPNDFRPAMRALLQQLDRWVKGEGAPPDSRIPLVSNRTLVAPERLRWPKIPNAPLVTRIQKAYRVDYGPKFKRDGIIENEPPKVGKEFPLLVPQVDADGNEQAGVRLPDVAVPLATYTGWNPFRPNSGPPEELSGMVGSYIPLPRTREEARAANDPRKPISERYRDKDDYLRQLRLAADALVKDGFLLADDLPRIVENGSRQWDWIMSQPAAEATN